MAFYECREAIAEQLCECLLTALMVRGLDTKVFVNQYNWLNSQYKDPYSYSLLLKGLKKEHAPTFSNVPSMPFAWLIRDNFEATFEALGLPTTQQEAARFERTLRRNKKLSEQQEATLLKAEFVAKEFEKISNWCVKARDRLAAMNANVALIASVTEEEKEFASSLNFDWYYSYSDSADDWRSGKAQHVKVVKHVQEVLAAKPYLSKVVEEVARAHGFGPSFFTELHS